MRHDDGSAGDADYGRIGANSAWSFVDPGVGPRFVRVLGDAIKSGAWDAAYGHLRTQPRFDGSLRLITARP